MSEGKAQTIARINEGMHRFVPHNRELGLEVVDIDAARGAITMRLPFAERLIGNPDLGLLHGGVITTLMDAACGTSVFVRLGFGSPIATLDLRIDYLKPATAGRDVFAVTECFKATKHVAFVRGVAHCGDPNDPVAAVAASFMRKDAS